MTPEVKAIRPAPRGGSHALPPGELEQAGRLMVFNWLLADSAHTDWLGPWARLLPARGEVDMRLLRRVSLAMIEHHGLQQRYLRSFGEWKWLLLPSAALACVAQGLGVAMLGGWVRSAIDAEQVAQQRSVLNGQQRVAAMGYAGSLKALPHASHHQGWPLARFNPSALFELGVSCLAALLNDHSTGSRERFSMRFARGTVVPLDLTDAQRGEAQELIHTLAAQGGQSSMGPANAQMDRVETHKEIHA